MNQTMRENWKEMDNDEVPAGYEPSWIFLIQPGQPALIVAFMWSWRDDPGATLIMPSWEEHQQGDFRHTQLIVWVLTDNLQYLLYKCWCSRD